MNPPKASTMLLGHPVVAVPALLAYAGVVLWAFNDPSFWPLVLILLGVMGPISNAWLKREEYRAWLREWDSMAEPPTGRHL